MDYRKILRLNSQGLNNLDYIKLQVRSGHCSNDTAEFGGLRTTMVAVGETAGQTASLMSIHIQRLEVPLQDDEPRPYTLR